MPMILSNYWPMSKDLTDAFRERTQVFHFTNRITERSDARKARMLQDELSGILNRFIAGLSRLRARGDWDHPQKSLDAHREWISHSNPAGMFSYEMLLKRKDSYAKAIDCWQAYLNWYKSSNPSGRPSSKSEFYERMESLVGVRVDRKGVKCFSGVCLREFD